VVPFALGGNGLPVRELNSMQDAETMRATRLLKTLMSAGKTRRNPRKKRSLCIIKEHFKEDFNAVSSSAVVFQQPAKPMTIRLAFTSLFILLWAVAAVSFAGGEITVLESGLRYQELVVGTGITAETGKIATIHMTGWLDDGGRKGDKFFDSRDQGQPIMFKIGTDRVMKAWNLGVVGMKPGGKRRLMVPASLGYGSKGVAGIVPPDSDLILEIELLDVR
jgi:hypothetical protein